MNLLKNLDVDILSSMFKKYPLYSQDNKNDPDVILEVFIPKQNIYWLLTEGSLEDNDFEFFGYCKIQCGELGYVSFNELSNLEYDLNYTYHKDPIKLSALKKAYEVDYENN